MPRGDNRQPAYPPEHRAKVEQLLRAGHAPRDLAAQGWASEACIRKWRDQLEGRSHLHRILDALEAGDRMDARTFDDALALLGMDDEQAADRLGTDGGGIIRAWRMGDLPLPLYVAKHVHSLVAAHRPKAVRSDRR